MIDSISQLLFSPRVAWVALAALVAELVIVVFVTRRSRHRLQFVDAALLGAPGALLLVAVLEAGGAQRGIVIAGLLGASWIAHLLDLRRRMSLSAARSE